MERISGFGVNDQYKIVRSILKIEADFQNLS